MGEVKLFGFWGSAFSRRIEIALKLKGIEYEYVEEDLSNKSEELLKYNPVHKKVPVLLHKGKPLAESQVILEYIDETWGGPSILPEDPYQRALARFWARFMDEKCLPTILKLGSSRGEEHEKLKEEVENLLQFLENELEKGGKKFFGGDSIGFVDIVGNFIAFWFGIILPELRGLKLLTKDKFPKLCEWRDEYLNVSVIKENLPPRDKLLAHFKARLEAAGIPISSTK